MRQVLDLQLTTACSVVSSRSEKSSELFGSALEVTQYPHPLVLVRVGNKSGITVATQPAVKVKVGSSDVIGNSNVIGSSDVISSSDVIGSCDAIGSGDAIGNDGFYIKD